MPLPNLEDPADPITSWKDRPPPSASRRSARTGSRAARMPGPTTRWMRQSRALSARGLRPAILPARAAGPIVPGYLAGGEPVESRRCRRRAAALRPAAHAGPESVPRWTAIARPPRHAGHGADRTDRSARASSCGGRRCACDKKALASPRESSDARGGAGRRREHREDAVVVRRGHDDPVGLGARRRLRAVRAGDRCGSSDASGSGDAPRRSHFAGRVLENGLAARLAESRGRCSCRADSRRARAAAAARHGALTRVPRMLRGHGRRPGSSSRSPRTTPGGARWTAPRSCGIYRRRGGSTSATARAERRATSGRARALSHGRRVIATGQATFMLAGGDRHVSRPVRARHARPGAAREVGTNLDGFIPGRGGGFLLLATRTAGGAAVGTPAARRRQPGG